MDKLIKKNLKYFRGIVCWFLIYIEMKLALNMMFNTDFNSSYLQSYYIIFITMFTINFDE